jgi:AcrR family transcriptional regulator
MPEGVRARRKAERPGQILEAAFEEFVDKGYAATRLEDVAARAGVTKGTIYFYFETKENLFVTMIRELSRPIHEELEGFLGDHKGTTREFVRAYLGFIYKVIAEDAHFREILRLLIAEAHRFPALVDEHDQRCGTPIMERLRQGLEEGSNRGEIRSAGLLEYPQIILGPALLLSVTMLLFSNRKTVDTERYFEAHVDLVLNGLLPRNGEVS